MERPVDHIFPQAERQARIFANFCVGKPFGCGQPITEKFEDAASEKEYRISGLCQTCQNEVFG